jgi:mono/diheme cytochrome c family protein
MTATGATLVSRRSRFPWVNALADEMKMKVVMARYASALVLAAFASLALLAPMAARAQTPLSAEEARLIEFGKEIFKSKAVCQYCHKWDASGDQGYGGNALSLRITQLTPEQLTEVVKCGRPGTGMPYHDRFAYTDKRCYGYTRDEMGKDMPPAGNDFLSNREVDAVVKYLFAKDVGKGPATYDDCVDFWGKDTKQCDPMKK